MMTTEMERMANLTEEEYKAEIEKMSKSEFMNYTNELIRMTEDLDPNVALAVLEGTADEDTIRKHQENIKIKNILQAHLRLSESLK